MGSIQNVPINLNASHRVGGTPPGTYGGSVPLERRHWFGLSRFMIGIPIKNSCAGTDSRGRHHSPPPERFDE